MTCTIFIQPIIIQARKRKIVIMSDLSNESKPLKIARHYVNDIHPHFNWADKDEKL